MKSFTLSYLDEKLEKEYQAEIYQQGVKKLTHFLFLQNLLMIFLQVLILSRQKLTMPYAMIGIGFFSNMVILLLLKRKSKVLMLFLKLNFVVNSILLTEIVCLYHRYWAYHEVSICLVIPFQIHHSMMIYIKSRWICTALFYLSSLLYFFLRVPESNHEQNYNIANFLLILGSSWLIHSYSAYDQELQFKNFYQNMSTNFHQANDFKQVLKNVIPTPIFLIDYKNSEIKFTNNSGYNLIGSKEQTKIFQNFENFIGKFFILRENPENEVVSSNTSSLAWKERNEPIMNLSQILRSHFNDFSKAPFNANQGGENSLEPRFQIINVWRNGTLDEVENLNENNEFWKKEEKNRSYFEIKTINIIWEKSKYLLLLFNDNTNVFRISELLNMDMYKNQLLASVSHDLRTPLNGLNGMLEVSISKTTHDKSLHDYLDLAKKSAIFLNFLVNDILDFSLMNFKKIRLNLEEVSLKAIIKEMLSLIEFQAKDKEVSLEFECLEEMQPIFSDSTRIKQILLNLLSNALKFTYKGSIKVSVEILKENTQNLIYKISVIDTGIGIKQEDLRKLFHLFGRLEDQKNINKTGIGLGLTISKKISKLLCPELPEGLQVQSSFGNGSTFYFFVTSLQSESPKKNYEKDSIIDEMMEEKHYLTSPSTYKFLEELDRMTSITAPSPCLQIALKPRSILVADDDLLNLIIAEEFLKLFNLRTLRALNGLEAYKIVKEDIKTQKYGISMIMMDCNMPILDGFQASMKIQKYCKKKGRNKMPILAVTANNTAADVLLCKNSGMDYFLEKPLKRDELKKTIEYIFSEKVNMDIFC